MKIKEWGEEGFIQHLAKLFPSAHQTVGIGDDCAVIPKDDKIAYLVTTDALVEGIHYFREQIPPSELGYKSIAVNVSDIAAMGGTPQYAFLSIALSKEIDKNWLLEFVQGIKEACLSWGIHLLGGDTVGSKRDLFINITLIGTASHSNIKYRHRALSGDIIFVTGNLGDSGGGLRCLQTGVNHPELIKAHFHPIPHVNEGLWLASKQEVHAMMDLSDGLNCDLTRIIKASGCGAIVELSKLPLSPALKQFCQDSERLALTGGEDYCLLATVAAEAADEIKKEFKEKFGRELHQIGKIISGPESIQYLRNGEPCTLILSNFDHFEDIKNGPETT